MAEKMCCFDGDNTKFDGEKLKNAIIGLIRDEGIRKFCFLRKSKLDSTAFAMLKEMKNTYPDILLGLVFPNIGEKISYLKTAEEYDFFLSDTISLKTGTGWQIKNWNEYMADCSDWLICHSALRSGRAFDTLKYAKMGGRIKIIEI